MPAARRCSRGSALLIPSGPQAGQFHLFALLIDAVPVEGRGLAPHVLLACVTSVKAAGPAEDCCLIQAGEHPFIEHDSYVDYRFTRLERADHIERCVSAGTFVPKAACPDALLNRIIAGALVSRRLSREYRQLLQRLYPG